MTVVSFSIARLTPDDLATFNRIAGEKLSSGRWSAVRRESGRTFDRLLVTLPDSPVPAFRFERARDSGYTLAYHDREGWYVIGAGPTARACLAIWLPGREK